MSLFIFIFPILNKIGINAQFGFGTMLLAHITFNIPYVILSVLPKLKQLPHNITEAALDLGATPGYAMWKDNTSSNKAGNICRIINGIYYVY